MPGAEPSDRTTRRALLGVLAVGASGHSINVLAQDDEENTEHIEQNTTYTLDAVILTSGDYPEDSELVQQETEIARYLPEYITGIFQQNGLNRSYSLGDIQYMGIEEEYCIDTDVVVVFEKASGGRVVIREEPECRLHPAIPNTMHLVDEFENGQNSTSGRNRDLIGSTFLHEYLHEYNIGIPEQYEFQENNQDTTGEPPRLDPWNSNQEIIKWDVMGAIDEYRDRINELNKYILQNYSSENPMPLNPGVRIYVDVMQDGSPVKDAVVKIWKRSLRIGGSNPLVLRNEISTGSDGRVGPLELDAGWGTYHGLMAVKAYKDCLYGGGGSASMIFGSNDSSIIAESSN